MLGGVLTLLTSTEITAGIRTFHDLSRSTVAPVERRDPAVAAQTPNHTVMKTGRHNVQTCTITVRPALSPARPTEPQQHCVLDQAIKYTWLPSRCAICFTRTDVLIVSFVQNDRSMTSCSVGLPISLLRKEIFNRLMEFHKTYFQPTVESFSKDVLHSLIDCKVLVENGCQQRISGEIMYIPLHLTLNTACETRRVTTYTVLIFCWPCISIYLS